FNAKIFQMNNAPVSSEFVIEWKVSPGMVVDSKSLADNAGILTFYNLDPKSLRADFDALQGYQPTQVEAL
ncbi:biotin carboxylase, partial [Pseudomonas syringae]|nr:biotin carboxylase [Pseudomonas syringae]